MRGTRGFEAAGLIFTALACNDGASAELHPAVPLEAPVVENEPKPVEAVARSRVSGPALAMTVSTVERPPQRAGSGRSEPAAPLDPGAPRVLEATVTRNVEAALATAGAEDPAALAAVVGRVLVWWLDPTRDLQRGDRLAVAYTTLEGSEPALWAVWFDGAKTGRRQAVLHHEEGAPFPRWVDPEEGAEVPLRLRHPPVKAYEQISALVGDGRGHRGVDFKAPVGTPVLATFDGEVTKVNWGVRRNGLSVRVVQRSTGIEASYLHLSEVDPQIRPGRKVGRGQRLGAVGNTGHSFAPHLHYQLERGGRVLDPFRVSESFRARMSEPERARAKARLMALAALRNEATP